MEGYQYEYKVPRESWKLGGSEIKSVQQQTLDRSHIGDPHWEAGNVKINHKNEINKEVIHNQYGSSKLKNPKSKVYYNE